MQIHRVFIIIDLRETYFSVFHKNILIKLKKIYYIKNTIVFFKNNLILC